MNWKRIVAVEWLVFIGSTVVGAMLVTAISLGGNGIAPFWIALVPYIFWVTARILFFSAKLIFKSIQWSLKTLRNDRPQAITLPKPAVTPPSPEERKKRGIAIGSKFAIVIMIVWTVFKICTAHDPQMPVPPTISASSAYQYEQNSKPTNKFVPPPLDSLGK
jgi:hypothetical protein